MLILFRLFSKQSLKKLLKTQVEYLFLIYSKFTEKHTRLLVFEVKFHAFVSRFSVTGHLRQFISVKHMKHPTKLERPRKIHDGLKAFTNENFLWSKWTASSASKILPLTTNTERWSWLVLGFYLSLYLMFSNKVNVEMEN